jgi:2-succinyl-5-enolpyruvyl-6-hydroxy-3-cyclohexene-1-carboxylate synthase
MKHSSIPSAQTVVMHCKAKGIENIVISPGSRNAPLTIGFTEDPYFKCFSIVDERSAAFFALGIAQQIKKPVAVLCTSGSALLNYYPAIAEAFYSTIPLVVISADRPVYKIDVGDGQTIRQDDVFHRHIGYSANLKQDLDHALERVEKYAPQMISEAGVVVTQRHVQSYNDTELNQALNTSLSTRLPVHINVPFEEPLYNVLSEPTVTPEILHPKSEQISLDDIGRYKQLWNTSERKMVLVGVNHPNVIEQRFLDILGNDPSVLVLTESTSNLHHPNFFASIDSIVAPIEKSEKKEVLFEKLRPKVLLTFGGLIVSKKIKAFLRQYQPKEHWHIDERKAFDTFFSLTRHFKVDPNRFFNEFLEPSKTISSPYFSYWNAVKLHYEKKREEYINQIGFSDMLAFYHICKNIPSEYQVQLANSSTVRYMQLFDMDPRIKVFCNRGTSGIDGSTSTAVGASIYDKEATLLITGDLSFLYDSNGLWNDHMRPDFKIILINNGGGGIFRILPGKEESPNFKTFFETVQHLDISYLCKMFGIGHFVVGNEKKIGGVLTDFFQQKTGPSLLEVRTPRILNDKILLGYFDFIS